MDTTKFWKWGIAAALLVLAILFAIKYTSSGENGAPPVRDASGAITSAGKTSIAYAKTGDCIASLPEGAEAQVGSVNFVPCSQEHLVVVAGFTETKDTSGDQAGQKAFEECTTVAIDFTGQQPKIGDNPYTIAILPPGDGYEGFMCLVDYNKTPLGTDAPVATSSASVSPSAP